MYKYIEITLVIYNKIVMPIAVEAVSLENYLSWLDSQS